MLATSKQISLLNSLSARIDIIKMRHPSVIPQGWTRQDWSMSMTSEKASARIDYHKAILHQAYLILFPWMKVAENEDLPA